MPNWKKVIVSGSNASLSSLSVATGMSALNANITGNVSASKVFVGDFTASGGSVDSSTVFQVNSGTGDKLLEVSGSGALVVPNIPAGSSNLVLAYNSGSGLITFQTSSVGDISSELEALSSSLSSEINDLENDLSNVSSSLASSLNTVQDTLSDVSSSLVETSSSLANTVSNIQSELSDVSSSFADTSSSLASSLSDVQNTLSDVSSSLVETSSSLASSVSNIQSDLSAVSSSLVETSSSLASSVSTIQSELTDVSSSLVQTSSSLANTVSNIETTLTDVSSSFLETSSSLATQVVTNSSAISDVSSSVSDVSDSLSDVSSSFSATSSSLSIRMDIAEDVLANSLMSSSAQIAEALTDEDLNLNSGSLSADTGSFNQVIVNGDVSISGTASINDVSLDTLSITVHSGSTVINQVPSSSFNARFYDYYIQSGSNLRAGSLMTVLDENETRYIDTSTTDIGDTSAFSFSTNISSGNLSLVTTTDSNGWTVKTFIRSL
jgi:predicted  nucleic acid-binding Zn-ribbon protein